MANWVGLTTTLNPANKLWVNLDNVALVTGYMNQGSKVVLSNGTEHIVADKPEDILYRVLSAPAA